MNLVPQKSLDLLYSRAFAIAKEVHKNDKRNDKITPYMIHIVGAMNNAREIVNKLYRHLDKRTFSHILSIVLSSMALHDVIEDHGDEYDAPLLKNLLMYGDKGDNSSEIIEEELVDAVISIVLLLTKKPKSEGQDYADYIKAILENDFAAIGKLADVRHNIIKLSPSNMRDKYSLAIMILENHLSKKEHWDN